MRLRGLYLGQWIGHLASQTYQQPTSNPNKNRTRRHIFLNALLLNGKGRNNFFNLLTRIEERNYHHLGFFGSKTNHIFCKKCSLISAGLKKIEIFCTLAWSLLLIIAEEKKVDFLFCNRLIIIVLWKNKKRLCYTYLPDP